MNWMKSLLIAATLTFSFTARAQLFPHGEAFTRQDTLRGTITPERAWWDLAHYTLEVKVEPEKQFLSGTNTMTYTVTGQPQRMQIDLQAPMKLTKAVQNAEELPIEHDGNAHFISLKQEQVQGKNYDITFHFSGKPVVAQRPPWDGGLTWQKDSNGLPFIANANQGIGSSVWWPNKDHPSDEPDKGVLLKVEVPENLMDVSNGRLIDTQHNRKANTKTYTWEVKNPINNYGININIGDYVHFSEKYQGEKGELDMDYYVLRDNLEKAKEQFKDAKRMMEAFEHWFGPYPFYEDGYKLVEVPYLGMEHQSSVTYGNAYGNGYLGRDLSGTGWGLKFDFIIIHESGHEWFANNITNKDVADMWIHEGFTAYSESLFLDYFYGKEAASDYVLGTRMAINNDRPVIGTYGVNYEGSGDMYYKGANMLHTIRQLINDDDKWREILRGLNREFYHQTVTTKQIENYISDHADMNLEPVFDQYLRDVRIPIFSYTIKNGMLIYRWENTVKSFNMPLKVWVDGEEVWLKPTTQWQNKKLDPTTSALTVDRNFYVAKMNVMGE
ncbi:M1 family peptidase [Echinicola strongylocentroti]|uniref:M1 family peptidase n=1 Tax=Echinicola strongylocentroti TaxID=1795355 RepID=A0A2Z4IIR2_9BACT|nr:M1 family metallopeptidase [Echinicola strongylocentroti]AWW30834.1 M1 family peptidase [Echinicola strongylocentroti]